MDVKPGSQNKEGKNRIRVSYDNRFQFLSASLMDVKPGSSVIEECRNKEGKNRHAILWQNVKLAMSTLIIL